MSDAEQVVASTSPSIAGETATSAAREVRTFPCENCGADFEFHIGAQSLKCPYCGFTKDVEAAPDAQIAEQDFHAMLAKLSSRRQEKSACSLGDSEFTCTTCAATIVFDTTVTSTDCAYCGSPVQRDHVHTAEDRIPVDAVLPFAVDKQAAQTNLRKWVKSRWFAPSQFKKRGVSGKFNGIYFPYWTFDSMTHSHYTGERGTYYYVTVGSGENKRQERRVRWTRVSGSFGRFFDDVLVCAAKAIKRALMQSLEPWPLHQCRPFDSRLLAGHTAMTYDQELNDGFGVAKSRMDDDIRSEVLRRIGGDTQRVHGINTQYNAITYKHVLLPVWIMAYQFHKKTYQVMVNACTGQVRGERPWSWVKITLASLAALAVATPLVYWLAQT